MIVGILDEELADVAQLVLAFQNVAGRAHIADQAVGVEFDAVHFVDVDAVRGIVEQHDIAFAVAVEVAEAAVVPAGRQGAELRVQIPVLNVPFRLIYAYNPNARKDQVTNGFPCFFDEKKSLFRFSVGRTF